MSCVFNNGNADMIYVFVWPGLLQGNIGHASILIEERFPISEPEIYISWWPASGGLYEFLTDGTMPARRYTRAEDEEAEGTRYHATPLENLDEYAMRAWWTQWNADPTYRLYHRNCCTTVMAGLDAGLHVDRKKMGQNQPSVDTPYGVQMRAWQIYYLGSG